MNNHRYADLLSLRLTCSDPQCGQSFQKSLGQLSGRRAIACPRCSKAVDLAAHRPAIDRLVELAVELEQRPSPSSEAGGPVETDRDNGTLTGTSASAADRDKMG
jgi:hypothetical protein